MKKSSRSLLTGVATTALLSLGLAASAGAATIFSLTDSTLGVTLDSGDSVTAGGITLTFTNVVNGGGDRVDIDGDGIYIGTSPDDAVSFDMTFSGAALTGSTQIISEYTVGYINVETTGAFSLTGNGTSGTNDLSAVGTFAFTMGTIPQIMDGQTYSFTHTVTNSAHLAQLKELSLDISVSEVPIPAAVWLFGSGLLGLVGMARRKKAA